MATTDKYDRQLRLWGAHGQRKLGTAKVIMLGTSPAGSEALKNLVLPGIGHITIVSDSLVSQRDLGNDFFVTDEDVGKSRAQTTLDLLLEMNPEDVAGEAVNMKVSDYINVNVGKIKEAQLIIACEVDDTTAMQISDICAPENIPMVLIRQYGMVGYLRLCKPMGCIIESKQASVTYRDLRVAEPFPELEAFCNEIDLDNIEQIDYTHVPYAVVQVKACQKWRSEHDGQMPTNFAQKNEFRAMLKSMMRFVVCENFDEAMSFATECFKKQAELPGNIQNIFENFGEEISTPKDHFWVMVNALKSFAEEQGRLPVQGTIPDMWSMPKFYLPLQRLYLAKSEADTAILRAKIDSTISQLNANGAQIEPLPQELLTMFVRNCHLIMVSRMRTIRQELEQPDWMESVAMEFFDNETNPSWLIAIKAFEKAAAKSADPSAFSNDASQNEAELALMKAEAKAMTEAMERESEIDEKFLKELLRYGRSQLHCVSSFIGGVASQEATKLIMGQYLPFNHTFVYDGVNGGGCVFEL